MNETLNKPSAVLNVALIVHRLVHMPSPLQSVDAHVAALLLKKYERDPEQTFWVRYPQDVQKRRKARKAAKTNAKMTKAAEDFEAPQSANEGERADQVDAVENRES
jgi:hypothetical protein